MKGNETEVNRSGRVLGASREVVGGTRRGECVSGQRHRRHVHGHGHGLRYGQRYGWCRGVGRVTGSTRENMLERRRRFAAWPCLAWRLSLRRELFCVHLYIHLHIHIHIHVCGLHVQCTRFPAWAWLRGAVCRSRSIHLPYSASSDPPGLRGRSGRASLEEDTRR